MKIGKPEMKPALMQALYNLTRGVTVAMRDDVKVSAFSILGVDPDSLGVVSKGAKAGTKISDKLLNASFSELKKDGLTHSPLRNRYALTDQGEAWCQANTVASNIASTQAPVVATPAAPEPEPAPEPEVVEVAPAPTPEPKAAPVAITMPQVKKAWKPEPKVAKQHTIDDYIQGLMVQSSPCFGVSPSSRAKTCKGCPVFSQCNSARNTRLIELAASMEAQASVGLSVIFGEAPAEEVVAESKGDLPPDTMVVPIEVDKVQCEHCHEFIEVGEKGAVVPGLGMFHVHCANAAAAAAQTVRAANS